MLVRIVRFAAIAVTLLALPAFAAAQVTAWHIDSGHSSANFTVQGGPMSVDGSFHNVAGTVNWDDTDVTKSSVDATVDVSTVSTANDKRDTHLKTPDFFDAAKFPKMSFKSTAVSKSDKGLKLEGDLTMHGVTKPVTLDVTGIDKVKPGETKRKLNASTTLSRKDFGIGMGFAESMISDKVKVTLHLELKQ